MHICDYCHLPLPVRRGVELVNRADPTRATVYLCSKRCISLWADRKMG